MGYCVYKLIAIGVTISSIQPHFFMKLKTFIVSLFIFTQAPLVAAQTNGGLIFECGAEKLVQLKSQLKTYQQELGVDPSFYEVHESGAHLRLS